MKPGEMWLQLMKGLMHILVDLRVSKLFFLSYLKHYPLTANYIKGAAEKLAIIKSNNN
jgi:hypothetical protein